ncbi:MAG: aminotransferase class V-fold PLP-dependent enzyme, partial [Planctomycetia bacterium]
VGLGAALALAADPTALSAEAVRLASLRDRFEDGVRRSVDEVVVNGPTDDRRLPSHSNLSFLGAKSEALLIALDLRGVCASAGAACSSGSLQRSAVLQAMGATGPRLDGAVRFTVGRFTTEAEIDRAVDALKKVVPAVRRSLATATL